MTTTKGIAGKGRGKNKTSRLAGLFSQSLFVHPWSERHWAIHGLRLLRYEKSFIALLCASFRSSNMTENPAQYGITYSCRGPNPWS
ncbi:MAG: hypothetical protein ABIJ50_09260 [Pseudomonadota bacterium]